MKNTSLGSLVCPSTLRDSCPVRKMLSGYSNMTCLSTFGQFISLNFMYAQTHPLTSRCRAKCASFGPHKCSSYSGAGMPVLSAVSSSFLSRDLSGPKKSVSWIPKLRRSHSILKASKDVPSSYRYPPMKKRPRWWWRTLACLPYLMPLHETWMYAETAYHLHPFLEDFEFLTYPFLNVIGKLPNWFLMAYFIVAYLAIVRRKEWPHFIRFHVVMGLLLEILLQVTGTVSRWMPQGLYWGKLGMHFWTAFAFGFLFTVLECMRCALAGMYADVPFVCDAAYIQIPYD